jgi:hypothetical protein
MAPLAGVDASSGRSRGGPPSRCHGRRLVAARNHRALPGGAAHPGPRHGPGLGVDHAARRASPDRPCRGAVRHCIARRRHGRVRRGRQSPGPRGGRRGPPAGHLAASRNRAANATPALAGAASGPLPAGRVRPAGCPSPAGRPHPGELGPQGGGGPTRPTGSLFGPAGGQPLDHRRQPPGGQRHHAVQRPDRPLLERAHPGQPERSPFGNPDLIFPGETVTLPPTT